jgi:hypothetical protein
MRYVSEYIFNDAFHTDVCGICRHAVKSKRVRMGIAQRTVISQ